MNTKLDKLTKNLNNLQAAESEKSVPVVLNKDIEDDYDFSRKKYRELIDKGSHALDGMMDLAAESEHPRAYEVLSNMMKNMSDMTDKLMTLQKSTKELRKQDDVPQSGGYTQNNVFVGSTTELQKMLRSKDVIDHGNE